MLRVTRAYIETLVNALSDENVTFKEGENWKTNIESKTITYNPRDLLQFDALTAKGLLLHELGHIKFTGSTLTSPIKKQYPIMKEVYNALEDNRIELKLHKLYGDFSIQALKHLNSLVVDLYTEQQQRGEQPYSKMNEIIKTSFFMNISNTAYDNGLYLNSKGSQVLRDILDTPTTVSPNFKSIFEKYSNKIHDIARTSTNASTTQELINYIDRELVPLIKDLLPEANKDYKAESPMSPNAKKILANPVDETKNERIRRGETLAQLPTDEELKALLSPYITTLTQKLQNVLKEKLAIKHTGAYKRGKLLSKNVYKVTTDESRIFSRRNKPDKPHYAVTILLDESGSMAENNAPNAYTAGILLDETSKKLGFKMKYIRYAHYPNEMKSISEYRTDFVGGGNNESRALKKVEEITDKTDDNLVFLFTDGGMATDTLKTALDHINKAGNYTVIGVGIALDPSEQESIRKYFPVFVNADNVQQLPNKIIGLLQQIIHR